MSDHRARYKNTGLDAKELRRRREEDSIQLRKQKRDDVLSKKRTLGPIELEDEHSLIAEGDYDVTKHDKSDVFELTQEMIDGIMQNNDLTCVLDNAQKVRRLLSKEPQPPFDEVIQSGLIPRLVQLLDLNEDPMLQFEVAWIMTNICSGTTEQTRAIVESGALPKLVELMRSPDMRVCEQAVWALGNIVGDGAEFRDIVISYGFVPKLLALLHPSLEVGFLRNATWVLVNLCRNKEPPTDLEIIRQLVPALMFLIESDDQTILVDTTWAVSYITEQGLSYCVLIIESGLVKKMTRLLAHAEPKIKTAAIRALGCIATGDEEQTQAVIDAGALPQLRKSFEGNNERVVKDALWFLSNILAGPEHQIQAVIDEQFVPIITHYLSRGDYHQQKEASWGTFNFCLSSNSQQLKVLIENNAIPALCDLLQLQDMTVVRNVLEAIKNLLKRCDTDEDHTVRDQIEECGGLDKIEFLQESSNQDIYQFAYTIIDEFFNDNDNAT